MMMKLLILDLPIPIIDDDEIIKLRPIDTYNHSSFNGVYIN